MLCILPYFFQITDSPTIDNWMKIGCAVLWHTAARLNQSTHDAWSGKFSQRSNFGIHYACFGFFFFQDLEVLTSSYIIIFYLKHSLSPWSTWSWTTCRFEVSTRTLKVEVNKTSKHSHWLHGVEFWISGWPSKWLAAARSVLHGKSLNLNYWSFLWDFSEFLYEPSFTVRSLRLV